MSRELSKTQDLGSRLARLRRARRLTQLELARSLGVTQGLISLYETGRAQPTVPMVAGLCRKLGCSADEILGLERAASVRAPTPETREELRLARLLAKIRELSTKDKRVLLGIMRVFLDKPRRAPPAAAAPDSGARDLP